MKKLIQSGNTLHLHALDNVYDKIPVGNYLLKYDPRQGYYLEIKEDFKLPEKTYGDNKPLIQRWQDSFEKNSRKNMGILMTGTKGAGKSLLAQEFCIESNRPVIMINEAFTGSDFVDYITAPNFDGSIILCDEFEKVFNAEYGDENYDVFKDAQKDFLGLMDGNFTTRLIFLLTVNDNSKLNAYFTNRLSRIKYRKHFTGLDASVIDSIIEDKLLNKDYKAGIYKVFKKIGICTMDLLIPLIDEINLFDESAEECAKHLNLQCEKRYYDIKEIWKGKEYECNSALFSLDDNTFHIEREWLSTERKLDKTAENELRYFTFKNGIDTIEIIAEDEVKITSKKGLVFKCTVKDNVTLVF